MMPPHPATTLFPYTTLFRSAAYEAPEHFKQYREGYERIKSAAKDHEQSQVGFEFGYKKFGDDLAMKARSEEHTSELQSRQYLVCRLLLENKNKTHAHSFTSA